MMTEINLLAAASRERSWQVRTVRKDQVHFQLGERSSYRPIGFVQALQSPVGRE